MFSLFTRTLARERTRPSRCHLLHSVPAKCCGVVQQIRQVPGPGGRLRVPSRTDGRRAGLSDLSARFTSLRKLVLHALSEAAVDQQSLQQSFVLVAGGRLVIPFLPGDACRTGRKKGLVLSFCN